MFPLAKTKVVLSWTSCCRLLWLALVCRAETMRAKKNENNQQFHDVHFLRHFMTATRSAILCETTGSSTTVELTSLPLSHFPCNRFEQHQQSCRNPPAPSPRSYTCNNSSLSRTRPVETCMRYTLQYFSTVVHVR